jgi:hypothetical protein
MPLFLLDLETGSLAAADIPATLESVADVVKRAGGEVIEAQVGAELNPAYVIVEHESQGPLTDALLAAKAPVREVAQVRLVGPTLEEVKARKGGADYLVEWDFPPDLKMDAYLARKREKAPLYAKVPEVKFLRTYVREDMVRCLCLYEAPDEDAVLRARQAVETPVSRVHRLAENEHASE